KLPRHAFRVSCDGQQKTAREPTAPSGAFLPMRKTAVVCLAISAVGASLFFPRAASSRAPLETSRAAGGARAVLDPAVRGVAARPVRVPSAHGDVLAYPPADATRPIVVYLHGVHGRAENGCPWMRAGTRDGWLLCPEPTVKDG